MSKTDDSMVRRLLLGRYRIVRLLATGGMGAVYLARVEGAAGFARPVVVKRILSDLTDSTDDRAQFIREAQILSNFQHPGIVNVIDFGKVEGAYLMVLEYVHGYHLGQWLKYVTQDGRWLPWESCIHVMLNVLGALHYAHTYTRTDGTSAGVIHRDISPSNILLDIDGNVRLADFGIARMQGDQTARQDTVDNIFRGKLSYAAPELFANENANPSTDIYSCGVVLYQLLSGSNPFGATEASDILNRVLTLVPPKIGSLRTDVPRELDEVVSKAIAKSPNDRYASARDIAAALRNLLDRPEADIAAETTEMIRRDFTGDLAAVLNLQSLEELDSAWRKSNGRSMAPLRSSMPPTVRLKMPGGQIKQDDLTVPAALFVQQAAANAVPHTGRKLVLTVVAAGLLAAGVAAAITLSMRSQGSPTGPRYLIVESSADSRTPGEPEKPPAESRNAPSTEAPAPSVSVGSTSAGPTRSNNKPRDPLSDLSRTLAKRQSAIQNCFQSSVQTGGGSPQISVRFSIDTQGKVLSAAVRPESLSVTPLGSCLQRVARSTDFGPQEKSMTFSIPITARAR